MLLTSEFLRTPHAFGDRELSVRATIASLYLSRKISLHFIARRNDVPHPDRWMVMYNARLVETLIRKYQALAGEFGFDYLVINTRLLDITAISIASHVIKGEHEEARRRFAEVLSAESESSERQVRSARERDLTESARPSPHRATMAA